MKIGKVLLLGFALMLPGRPGQAAAASATRTPVVVELFTSEGCSSCPPADALLTKLSQQSTVDGAEVFVLGEHVDYWDQLGWKDRFSSPALTARQEGYAKEFHLDSAYTPQMVIDGRFQTVGNDASSVDREIARAAQTAKAASVTLAWTDNNSLRVAVQGAAGGPFVVLLAVTEDGLTTSVGGGENGGRVLRHSGVVRELRQLGRTADGAFVATASVPPAATWKPGDLRVIVFVQKPGGEIVGAGAVKFR